MTNQSNPAMTSQRSPNDILREAAKAFAEHDRIHAEMRAAEARVQALCSEYGSATRRWGYAPYHLRRAVEAQIGEVAA
jgi:hypothetical protein